MLRKPHFTNIGAHREQATLTLTLESSQVLRFAMTTLLQL